MAMGVSHAVPYRRSVTAAFGTFAMAWFGYVFGMEGNHPFLSDDPDPMLEQADFVLFSVRAPSDRCAAGCANRR